MRRWVVPLLAAAAVLVVIAVMWHQRPGAGGPETGPAAGGAGSAGSAGGGVPPSVGSGVVPSAGVEPGSPGVDEPVPIPDLTATPKPGVAPGRHQIAVDSYFAHDARRLALNYTNGVPECYGTAGEVQVRETAGSVMVTIPRVPPEPSDEGRACIDIALLASVDITLEQPLGDRVVRDGSRAGAPVEPAEAPYGPPAE